MLFLYVCWWFEETVSSLVCYIPYHTHHLQYPHHSHHIPTTHTTPTPHQHPPHHTHHTCFLSTRSISPNSPSLYPAARIIPAVALYGRPTVFSSSPMYSRGASMHAIFPRSWGCNRSDQSSMGCAPALRGWEGSGCEVGVGVYV